MSRKPNATNSSNAAPMFEPLETRSMMAAQLPLQLAAASVDFKSALHAPAKVQASTLAAPVLALRVLSPDQVRLTWSAVSGATSYTVEKFVGHTGVWEAVGTTTDNHMVAYDLHGNRLYRFHVIATDANGNAAPSEINSMRPNAALDHLAMRAERIANLVETFRQQQTELVAANLDKADDLDFRRSIRRDQVAFAAQMAALDVDYRPVAVETMLPQDTGGLNSAPPRLSTTPPTVTTTVRSATELAVNWGAITGGIAYKIERTADAGTTWATVAYATGTRFIDVGLTPDTAYQYRVSVITASDTSAASAAVAGVTNPVAPLNLAATTTNATTIALTWSTVANATSYRIDRSIDNATWTALVPGTALTGVSAAYSDTTAAAGTTYYYRITTVNAARSSSASDPINATTMTAVTTVTATAQSGTRVNLTWTPEATAFEYVIERSDDAGTTWSQIATSSTAHFVDAGLTPNTAYQYRVSSTNAGGTTAPSAVANVTSLLATVAGFTATPAAGDEKVTLAWTAVTDATGYRIDRSTNQTTWTALAASSALAGTDATMDDTTVSAGTTYYYRIIALSAGGNGAAGDSVSALTRPATPGSLTATLTAPNAVTLVWTAVPTATSYLVEKTVDGGTTWTTLGTPAGLTLIDAGLNADANISYRVSGTNATGSSNPTSGTTITTAPATPTGLAVSFDDANNQNQLSWTAVTDASTYIIERSVAGAAWTTLSTSLTGTDTSYNDASGITPGTSYRYRISATNSSGTSLPATLVTVLTEPAIPTLTAAPASATSVTLTWTASTSATGYTLQSSPDAGTTWTTVYTGANTTYTNTGLTADTAYSYQVLATNATGDSAYSTAAATTTLLAAPTSFAALSPNGTSVTLTWDASTDATGYLIERSANAGSTWTTLVPSPALAGTDVTYTDTGLTPSTAYRYRLSAISLSGTSAPATAVNIATRVGVPTGLAAVAISATSMGVSWTAVTGATSYKLESSPDGTTWTELTTQAGLTYTNTGLTANTAYQYRVSAIASALAGTASAPVTGRTLLAAPVGFAAAAPSGTSVTLTWTASTGATSYKIERSANAGSTWTVLTPSPVLGGTDVTYTDTGLTTATSYQYRLSAISTAGTSVAAAPVTVLTRTVAPVSTGTVTSATAVSLTWATVTGATSYVVQKSVDNGTTWSAAGTPSTTTAAVTGLTANTAYLFRVFAANASGNSVASTSVALRTTIGAPTNLATTSVTATAVNLSWTVVAGATGYKLEKAIGTGAYATVTPATAFTGTSATYSDTGLTAGTVYKYRISAINTFGTSLPSTELSTVTRPFVPVVTTTTASTTQINLAWAAVASATSYKVEISADAGTTWTVAGTPSTLTYNATGLLVDHAYSFRVSAINASGAGAASIVVSTRTLLAAPTGFTLLDTDSTDVTLAWTPSDNATTYVLERSANAGTTWTTVAPSPTLSSTDSSYTDTGLTGGTSYVYRLSASNAAGTSAPTATVTAVTLPAAPTLTATPISQTAVNLSWTASATATSYRVERSANAGGTWTTIASPVGTSFSDTGVQAARNYSYRVSAVNNSGVGDTSAEVVAATLLAAPTGLSATTVSATAISISWTAPTGATGYKIERSLDTNTWTTLTQAPVLGGTATFFSSTGLTAGTDYYYRITATGPGTIVSPTSSTVRGTTLLAAPTGLAAVAASTSVINLTWAAVSSPSRQGFKLQRSPNGTNSWATIATPAAGAVSYSNTGLTGATRYFYRLIAVSLAGDSAAGAVVNTTTK